MKKTLSFFVALMIISSVAVQARRLDKPTALTGMAVVKSGSTVKVFYKGSKRTKVTVTIYDTNNKPVLVDYVGKFESFVRPYDFSSLAEGEYTIELKDEDGTRSEKIQFATADTNKFIKMARVGSETDRYLLSVSNRGKEAITVKIFNANGEALYVGHEQLDGDFAKVYNLEQIIGKVTFEITDSHGTTKTFNY